MKHYKLSEVVTEISERVNNPATSGYSRFVGLEHYVSGDVEITKYGSTEKLESAMKVFHSGDILIARRNVYLRRASVVLFDGLTSGDSIVLRAKDERIARLLPFVFNTDSFWDFADTHADGTMSKRLSPKTLMQYEFDLPDEDKQEELANLLWAANEVRNRYRDLLIHTDELVKSQFIEMIEPYTHATVKAGLFFTDIRNGVSPSTNGTHHEKVLTLSAVTQGAFDPDAWKEGNFDAVPPSEKRISDADFYMCRGNGNKTLVGTGVFSHEARPDLVFPDTVIAARVNQDIVSLPFLFVAWQMPAIRQQIESRARTTNGTYKINQSIITNIEIALPPMPVQETFTAIIDQADKSKFELKQSIERVTALMKSLML